MGCTSIYLVDLEEALLLGLELVVRSVYQLARAAIEDETAANLGVVRVGQLDVAHVQTPAHADPGALGLLVGAMVLADDAVGAGGRVAQGELWCQAVGAGRQLDRDRNRGRAGLQIGLIGVDGRDDRLVGGHVGQVLAEMLQVGRDYLALTIVDAGDLLPRVAGTAPAVYGYVSADAPSQVFVGVADAEPGPAGESAGEVLSAGPLGLEQDALDD